MKFIRKNFSKIAFAIFLVLGLSIPIIASSSKADINISFIDIKTLKKQEVNNIKHGPIKKEIKDREYNYQLVYKKVSDNNSIAKAGKELPIAIVTSALIVSSFLYYDNRKKGRRNSAPLLIFALVTGVTFIGGQQVYAQNDIIKNSLSFTVEKGKNFEYSPDKIKGYKYVGYLEYGSDIIEPPIKNTGRLIVNFKSSEGKTLKPELIYSGTINKLYNIIPPNISGYKLKSIDGLKDGIYKKEDQRLTFIYEKQLLTKGKVTIEYIDTDNKVLSQSIVLEGNIGEAFHVDQKTFKGYTFKERQGSTTNIFEATPKSIKMIYEKNNGKLIINFINSSTTTNTKNKVLDLNTFNVTPLNLDNYFYIMKDPITNQDIKLLQNDTFKSFTIEEWNNDLDGLPETLNIKLFYKDAGGNVQESFVAPQRNGYAGTAPQGFESYKAELDTNTLQFDETTNTYTLNYIVSYIPVIIDF